MESEKKHYVIYELDETGVLGELEATGTLGRFCSQACMDKEPRRYTHESREDEDMSDSIH